MKKSETHNFWRDPNSDRFGVTDEYKAKCQPEHYVNQKVVSEMWLSVFHQYVRRDASILELGCSVGRNLYFLKQDGYNFLAGVEINPRAVEIAGVEFGMAEAITNASIENYLPSSQVFDVVFTSGVLMHLHPKSEWVFDVMAHIAEKFIIIAEVENPEGLYKWPRNYREIFEGFGFTQVHEQSAPAMSDNTILRVFKRSE